jgi:hypothetical protein
VSGFCPDCGCDTFRPGGCRCEAELERRLATFSVPPVVPPGLFIGPGLIPECAPYCCPRCHRWHATPADRQACRDSHHPWAVVMAENFRAVAGALHRRASVEAKCNPAAATTATPQPPTSSLPQTTPTNGSDDQ